MTIEVFKLLNNINVPYVVWKDTYKVEEFLDGNAELDLLVKNEARTAFESAAYESGFMKLEVRPLLQKKDIEHYIRYHGGKYFHLHVYYKIRTGNHYVKEYCFDVIDHMFSESRMVHNVNVVNEVDELALLLLRLSIKKSAIFSLIKKAELERAKYLVERVNLDDVRNILKHYSEDANEKVNLVIEGLAANKILGSELVELKECFNSYRTKGVFRFYINLLITRGYLMVLRAKRSSNKTLSTNGVTLSIMGTDGSGKSTVVNELSSLFSAKTSSRTIYLGSNIKTYSFVTRVYFYIYKILRVFSPLKDKYYFSWVLYNFGLCLLEYGKAKDRQKRATKGETLKNDGWIVIYERFPIIGLFDFPNKLYTAGNKEWFSRYGGKIIARILAKIKVAINNIEKPDMAFLLTVDFETMLQRRRMDDNEIIDIKNKLASQKKYIAKSKSDFYIVDNNNNFIHSIEFISNKISGHLCKSNS